MLKVSEYEKQCFHIFVKNRGMGSVSIDFSIKFEAVKMCPLFGFLWFSNNA